MTQHFLDGTEVRAVFQKVRGKRMAESMGVMEPLRFNFLRTS